MAQIITSQLPALVSPPPSGNAYEWLASNPKKAAPTSPSLYRLDGKVTTRAEVEKIAGQVASFVRDTLGLTDGDRIAIVSPNTTMFQPTFLGLLRAGITAVPLNPIYSPDELVHPLADSDISAALVHPVSLPAVQAAWERAGRKTKTRNGAPAIWIVNDTDKIEAAKSGERDIRTVLDKEHPIVKISDPADREAVIVYSSGTSGKPKGVQLTHGNLVAGTDTIIKSDPSDINDAAVAIGVLPMFHIFGLNLLLMTAFLTAMPVVVVPRFDIEIFCAAIQRFRVTMGLVVPPMLLLLSRSPVVDKYDLSSFRSAICGAAPLSAELGDEVEKRLPNLRVTQGYGLSETAPVLTITPSKDYRKVRGSCGTTAAGVEIRLVDEEHGDVGHQQGKEGRRGEVWARGPIIMKGYLNNREATDDCITPDGWFKTGDIAICRDGYFYIVDRKKELIKYKGFQVPPAELEALLLTHPRVFDTAVIGVHSKEQATELPRAYCVPRDFVPSKADKAQIEAFQKEVEAWVAERVANHKRLRGGVIAIDQVPKSASGKILRRLLRDEANREQS
ncbi:hypothetical protein MCUN1_000114 [Malassezia cuniculi]|uniref:Acetyl-CoA synthetase-like protein n=1 Tax=Malassezia cuniculi TaxID=948313 RepID=A0AAF0J9H0_9BASI|nr:hypothetical protein MCUN1_000114 [Malassezia cuniculi]